MELNVNTYKLNRYVLGVLRASRKNAENLIADKFNAFYNWNVGNLTGDKLKKELEDLIEKEKVSEKLEANPELYADLALIYQIYLKQKKENVQGNTDWRSIRKIFQDEKGKESEKLYGNINWDFNRVVSSEVNSKKSKLGVFKDNNIESMIDDIKQLLEENIEQGEWFIKYVLNKNKYNFAIINVKLENPSFYFEKALKLIKIHLKELKCESEFSINEITLPDKRSLYIKGSFSLPT